LAFKNKAAEFCFETLAFMEALGQVPIIPKPRLDQILNYLLNLSLLIIELATARLNQASASDALNEAHQELKKVIKQRKSTERSLQVHMSFMETLLDTIPAPVFF
jgi:hypothetical protein